MRRTRHGIPIGFFQIPLVVSGVDMKCGAEGVGDLHFFQTAFFFYFADGALFDGFAGFQVAFGQIVHSQTFDSQQAVVLPDYAAGSLDIGKAGFEYCEQLFYIIVEYGSCKGLGMVEQPQDKLFGGLKFPVFERKGGFLSEIRLFCQEKTDRKSTRLNSSHRL